jgi:uncharacterized protein (TIGR02001 family)
MLTALRVGMALAGLAAPARGQINGSLGLQSDYRFRGISLSRGRPAVSASLAYDHPSGFYAGAQVIGEDQGGPALLGHIEYLGFATPKTAGPAFDIGVNNESLSQFADRRYPLNYAEVYAGVIGDHLSAHLYYSPNYFRPGLNTGYATIDGVIRPADQWRLFGHLGTTFPIGGHGRRQRYDLRAGVARQFRSFEVQAAVTATSPAPPASTPQSPAALVIAASYFF